MNGRVIFVAALTLLVATCGYRKEPNRFSDPILVSIADFQDKRQTDSLFRFLKSSNVKHRSAAVLAFASIQDTAASPFLGTILLEDPDNAVRIHAAFALGQTGGIAAVNSLIPSINDPDPTVVRHSLEALGKTVSERDLKVLIQFKADDSIRQEGLAWAYYRLAIRKINHDEIVRRQAEFLSNTFSQSTRLAAAQFFDRVNLKGNAPGVLAQSALNDPSPEVRMASAGALRKLDSTTMLATVGKILAEEKDFRVRVNAIKATRLLSFIQIRKLVLTALSDKNTQVKIAASEVILMVEGKVDLIDVARNEPHERVQANLYGSILKTSEDPTVLQNEIKQQYKNSHSSYQKAHLLNALSNATASYPFLFDELIQSKEFVIKTAAAQGLANIHEHKDFTEKHKAEFATYFEKAIADGDPGVISIVASVIADSTLNYRPVIRDATFLKEARQKLHLPKDIESLQPLDEAIAYLEGKSKPKAPKDPFGHPINWALVKSLSKDQRVSVKTSQGEFVIRLLVEEAPGSIANFVELIGKKYFDGRFVHRMVPNFVLQTGCNRGDGFGSEDYAIRSEFSTRRYITGSVGFASAGKDTEGTQWFVTHSPTPHLEGRYTIFAEVEKGMDIADLMGVGDTIISVTLID